LLGHVNEAEDYFKKALKISEEIKDYLQMAYIYYEFAYLYSDYDQDEKAQKAAKKTLEIFNGLKEKTGVNYPEIDKLYKDYNL
jgi:hypothetical protein